MHGNKNDKLELFYYTWKQRNTLHFDLTRIMEDAVNLPSVKTPS